MIRSLTYRDINQVVALHKIYFPHDTLTLFGDEFLRILYQGLLEQTDTHAFGVIYDNKLIGFIIGVADSKTAMSRTIRNHFSAFILALVPRLLRPQVLKKIGETFFYGKSWAGHRENFLLLE